MRDEGWQARLQKSVAERREWAARQPAPWWVRFDELPQGVFAEGTDRIVIARTLLGMRVPVRPAPTDRAECEFYALDGVERLAVDEDDMPAVMRCVRMSGLHGTYRRAGDEKEYRF